MSNKIKKLIAEKAELLERLAGDQLWVLGSIVETERTVNKKKVPFFYLSKSSLGKNKTTYISKANLQNFKKARANGRLIQKVIYRIAEINISLLKKQEV